MLLATTKLFSVSFFIISNFLYFLFCYLSVGGRCVMKMDHHCPWINTCVGHYNHGHFTAFLASAVGGCTVSTVILVSWVMTVLSMKPLPFPRPSRLTLILAIFSIGLSIGVVIAVGMLLYIQVSDRIVRSPLTILFLTSMHSLNCADTSYREKSNGNRKLDLGKSSVSAK